MSKGGGGNKPAGNTTTTQTNEPWSGAVPYINKGLEAAGSLYDAGGPQYYPGSTYAGPNSTQLSALQNLGNASQNYSPLFNAGKGFVNDAYHTGQSVANQGRSIFNYAGGVGNNAQQLAGLALGYGGIGNGVLGQSNSIFNYAGGLGDQANNIGGNAQHLSDLALATGSLGPSIFDQGNSIFDLSRSIGNNAQGLGNATSGIRDIGNSIFSRSGDIGNSANDMLALSKSLGSSSYTDNPSSALFAGQAFGDKRLPGIGALSSFANGDYLSADNPYFKQMADRISAEVLPQTQAGFIGAGRGVSGLGNRASALGLGDAIGGLAYNNYQQGLQQKQQAADTLAGLTQAGAQGLAGNYSQMMADKFNAGNLGLGALGAANNAANLGLGAGQLGLGAINSGIAANQLGLGAGQLGLGAGQLNLGAGNFMLNALSNAQNSQQLGLGAGNLGLGAGNLGLNAGQLGLGAGNFGLNTLSNAQNAEQLGLGAGNLGLGAGSQGINASNLGLSAAQLLPTLQAMGIGADSTSLGAGSTQQQLDQQAINDAIQRWNYQQNAPLYNLQNYISNITAQTGGTGKQTSTQPYFQNNTANDLSTGLSAAMLAAQIIPML